MPSAIPCSLSRIHFCLFSDWSRTGTVSSKFFVTQVHSISTEELALPRHARCVLSPFRCIVLCILLSSCLSRIGKIDNPSCSACGHSSQNNSHSSLSSYGLFAPPPLWRLTVSTTSGSGPGELPGFCDSVAFRHAPITQKGSGDNNTVKVQATIKFQNTFLLPQL